MKTWCTICEVTQHKIPKRLPCFMWARQPRSQVLSSSWEGKKRDPGNKVVSKGGPWEQGCIAVITSCENKCKFCSNASAHCSCEIVQTATCNCSTCSKIMEKQEKLGQWAEPRNSCSLYPMKSWNKGELCSHVAALPWRVDIGVPAFFSENRYQSVCRWHIDLFTSDQVIWWRNSEDWDEKF